MPRAITDRPPKKKFILLDSEENVVATLIDRALAEKWVVNRKRGAIRVVEGVISPGLKDSVK
jgi:hypothetical protein